MAYTARTLLRIKLGVCLDCEEASSGCYRRCLRCRRKRAKTKPKAQLPSYWERRRAERAADRAAGRGYWPEIYGEV
jgi:hypothetical protein